LVQDGTNHIKEADMNTSVVVQSSTGKHKYQTRYMTTDDPEAIREAVADVESRVKPGSKVRVVRVHHYETQEVIEPPFIVGQR